MNSDEQAIRDLVDQWHAATRRGDYAAVLALMAEDAIFLGAGRPPMTKEAFAAATLHLAGAEMPRVESTSDIQEIQVCGDLAYLWTRLRVVATPPRGGASVVRAGHSLAILRKSRGGWLLVRDANMLAVVENTTP